MRRAYLIQRTKSKEAVIIEVFFDADRNDDASDVSVRSKKWRILVWKTVVGDKEIDPDAEYYDAFPGVVMSYTEAEGKARDLASEMPNRVVVYLHPIIAAKNVLDLDSRANQSSIEHRFTGAVEELWEPSNDSNHGQSRNSEEEGTTLS